jgi:triosephosphate isomerase
MEPKPLLVASHKLFLGLPDAVGFARGLRAALERRRRTLDVAVSPSLVNLAHVADVLRDSTVAVAAQNVHQEVNGAFTGQVSLQELVALRVQYVVIGHSEVVAHQHDGTETLSNKIQWCVRHGVRPIVCVSDDGCEDERAGGLAGSGLRQLLVAGLREMSRAVPLIAYEPSSPQACDTFEGRQRVSGTLQRLRAQASALLGPAAGRPQVLYGGGVTPGNVGALTRALDVDGFFVGRASTQLPSFLSILDGVEEAITVGRAAAVAAEGV